MYCHCTRISLFLFTLLTNLFFQNEKLSNAIDRDAHPRKIRKMSFTCSCFVGKLRFLRRLLPPLYEVLEMRYVYVF